MEMIENLTGFVARWAQEKISSEFLRALKRMDKGKVSQAIVIFEEQLSKNEGQTLQAVEKEAKPDKVQVLKSSSQKAQEGVTEFFEKEAKEYFTNTKNVDFEQLGVKRLPLLDTMIVPATPKLVEDIVAKPSVIGVIQNQGCEIIQPLKTEPKDIVTRETRDGITWGLKRLKVHKIWEEGFKGEGVRIGHLDTGVYAAHSGLLGKIVEWMAFSPQGEQLVGCPVYDSASHGTHTAGTIVGGRC